MLVQLSSNTALTNFIHFHVCSPISSTDTSWISSSIQQILTSRLHHLRQDQVTNEPAVRIPRASQVFTACLASD
ncbi:hypothetical protein PHSY_002059 [Pseudozyma hubeiensis SY62]|uniref:Uncharacterized protein n=1 Tax=Pseudozyma hubeiensis (strain SY62) TaxID=1305764 RepID=R9P0D8_PSEHS|nr:hypothetical protein PHSY_002059 [Pseudozyma hubeiensis SY62]GAC94487.1 hypothetical protein PHSY_002059 [Pseudozyma hubeiensis SY62]